MDDETREALEMTEDELRARWEAGKPARVSKRPPRDLNQRAAGIVAAATEDVGDKSPSEVRASGVTRVHFEGNRNRLRASVISVEHVTVSR